MGSGWPGGLLPWAGKALSGGGAKGRNELSGVFPPKSLEVIGGEGEVAVALDSDGNEVVDGVVVFGILEDGILGYDRADLGKNPIGIGGPGSDVIHDGLYLLDDV